MKLHQRGMDKQMSKTIIIALFGESGAGKDSLQKEIIKQSPSTFSEIISTTTRPPREYEKEGVDYNFISDDQAKEYLENNEYLEHTEFRGWTYGTLKSTLKSNFINIGVFNIEGIEQLINLPQIDYIILPIHIICSDKERLLRQLNREKAPDCAEICRRFQADQEDFQDNKINFPHLVAYNENIDLNILAIQLKEAIYENIILDSLKQYDSDKII